MQTCGSGFCSGGTSTLGCHEESFAGAAFLVNLMVMPSCGACRQCRASVLTSPAADLSTAACARVQRPMRQTGSKSRARRRTHRRRVAAGDAARRRQDAQLAQAAQLRSPSVAAQLRSPSCTRAFRSTSPSSSARAPRRAATLAELHPGLQVYGPELFGAGTPPRRATVLLRIDVQQRWLCEYLVQKQQEWALTQGVTLLGVGQGGLVAPALVQRGCANGPEVRTARLGAEPAAARQGVMRAPADEEMRRVLDGVSMDDPHAAPAQNRVARGLLARLRAARPLSAATLLADLNAENGERPEYAARLSALDALVLVGSSCFFGFYVDASPTPPGAVVLLRDSSAYQQDHLGLRTLDEKGALHVLDAKCLHYADDGRETSGT